MDSNRAGSPEPNEMLKLFFWKVPFIHLVHCGVHRQYSLIDELRRLVKLETTLVPEDFRSRTNEFNLMMIGIGKFVLKHGSNFGICVEHGGTYKGKMEAYKLWRSKLEEIILESRNVMSVVEKSVRGTCSVFWFLPPIYVFGLIAHMVEVSDVEDIMHLVISSSSLEYTYPEDKIKRISHFFKDVQLSLDLEVLQEVNLERTLFGDVKTTSSFQESCSEEYGFIKLVKHGNDDSLIKELQQTLPTMEKSCIPSSLQDWEQNLAVLSAEWDMSVEVSKRFNSADESNLNRFMYGFENNNYRYIKPWGTILQISNFQKQVSIMLKDLCDKNMKLESRTHAFKHLFSNFISAVLLHEKDFLDIKYEEYSKTIFSHRFTQELLEIKSIKSAMDSRAERNLHNGKRSGCSKGRTL